MLSGRRQQRKVYFGEKLFMCEYYRNIYLSSSLEDISYVL